MKLPVGSHGSKSESAVRRRLTSSEDSHGHTRAASRLYIASAVLVLSHGRNRGTDPTNYRASACVYYFPTVVSTRLCKRHRSCTTAVSPPPFDRAEEQEGGALSRRSRRIEELRARHRSKPLLVPNFPTIAFITKEHGRYATCTASGIPRSSFGFAKVIAN